ncbi:unnamed protein product, partial [Pleuronectes platessa]
MMRQALVSVAAAAFVVLSGAGQADKGALRSVQSGVTGVGAPPPHRGRGDPLDRWPQGRDSDCVNFWPGESGFGERSNAHKEDGYGVMVLNPNENYREVEKPAGSNPLPSASEHSDEPAEKKERKDDKEGKKKREFYEKYRNPQKETETEWIPVRENGSSEEHVLYVWDNFVSKAAAKNVFIMAHSYGGLSFVEL